MDGRIPFGGKQGVCFKTKNPCQGRGLIFKGIALLQLNHEPESDSVAADWGVFPK